ncbi:MAG: glycosyltransferase [Rhodoglobus sp.]
MPRDDQNAARELPRQRTSSPFDGPDLALGRGGSDSPRLQLIRPRRDALPGVESHRQRLTVQFLACTALLATVAYLGWRTGASLAGSTLWLSIPLLLLEVHAFVGLALFTHDLWNVDERPNPPRDASGADQRNVESCRVAVLIPTYNEPREILLPTIAAAVATRREHETWVLDDGDRPWVRELAGELGARYRSRRNGAHAKAGNLNEALAEVGADIVAVVDADHVVTEGFLEALLPYFADPLVAVVQSPQDFYNDSSFEHVPLPGGGVFADQEMFYRAVLAGRNRWHAAFWCGTGALVRVAALESVGGVATDSVTEDILTTLRMHRKGWRTVHHNEVVAHGLAAHDPASFFIQRNRWGAGAMQVLRHENPALGHGLTVHQRISYLSTLLGWFDSWRTIGYVLLPILTLLSGGLPVAAPWKTFLVAFTGCFLLQRIALSTLSRGRAPLLHATYFEFVRLPATFAATLTIFGPGPTRFAVTPKAASRDRTRAPQPFLLVTLLALSVIAAGWYLATLAGLTPTRYAVPWVAHGTAFWLVVNACFLTAAQRRIRQMRFASNRRDAWRFATDIPVLVQTPGEETTANLTDISITGARLLMDGIGSEHLREGDDVVIQLPLGTRSGTAMFAVPATLRSLNAARGAQGRWAGARFHLTSEQQAQLALSLYRTVDTQPKPDDDHLSALIDESAGFSGRGAPLA